MAPASTETIRNLRLLTLFCSTLTTPMLIAMTVIAQSHLWSYYGYWRSHRSITAFPFAFIPLAITFAAGFSSIVHQRRKGELPGPLFGLFDAAAIVFYLATLIPIWAVEVSNLSMVGHALLLGYATAPMIVNMFVHVFLFYQSMRPTWTAIKEVLNARCNRECPHCGHASTSTNAVPSAPRDPAEYSLLRGEVYLDDDATPRQSADLAAVASGKEDFNANAALNV